MAREGTQQRAPKQQFRGSNSHGNESRRHHIKDRRKAVRKYLKKHEWEDIATKINFKLKNGTTNTLKESCIGLAAHMSDVERLGFVEFFRHRPLVQRHRPSGMETIIRNHGVHGFVQCGDRIP